MLIGMLGPFEVRTDDGVFADVPGARLRALLVALALEPGHAVPKARLVGWIWGEHPPADATNALQRLVSRLRKALPEGSVEGQPDGYRLTVEPGAVDAVRFERLVGQARNDEDPQRAKLLRAALGLWRGAAMQDVGLQDSDAFDAAVTRLEGLRLAAMEDRFEAEIRLGRGGDLVAELTDLVAAHPVRERLVAALMRALAAAGRPTDALLVYQRTREALADALGVDPSPELSALHVTLLRGESGRREENRKTNLRAELTSFVGKDADVTAVRELIAEHRLTTLIGPGGSGKTRLATETTRTLLDDLPDGAWLVELAAIGADGDKGGGNDVAQAALAGLGLRDALLGGAPHAEPVDRLIAAIRERETLMILDNCEHVIESAAAFAHRVLGECRRLRILATSREPLGITGEALWLVEPLALPDGDAGPGEIESSPAVRLLRDRAGAVRKDLAADAHTLSTMVRVCRALDGMPLGIELAAARLRTMSIDQLAHRLDDRFRLLTGGSRTALPRHRTLRAVVDWSWELLTDAERMVLRRLSVFSGGASLEAAERVCAGDTIEQEQVLELLTALAEKSLVVAEGDGAPRYRMLGTIKEYAAQRLAEAAESDLARHAHLAYFTELAETAEPRLRRAEQLEWLAALEVEHDNLGAAMRAALAAGEAPEAMRLAAGAGWYWWLGGHKSEGMELLTATAETPGEVADEIRATVYALISMFVGSGPADEHAAAEWIHKAYRFGRRSQQHHPALRLVVPLERMLRAPDAFLPAWELLLDDTDPWVRALARLHLGKMRIVLGHDGREADAYLEAALAEFRAIGERWGISFALSELADRIAVRGEFTAACEHYEQAVAVVTEAGAIEDVIRMRSRQAQLYWLLGDEDSSAAAIAEAVHCAERVTWPDALALLALSKAELARWRGDAEEAYDQLGVATTILGDEADQANIRAITHDLLGYLADDLGDARAHRAAACEAAAEAGHAPSIAQVLVGVADLALRREQYEQAARLLAAGAAVRGLQDRSHPDVGRIEQAARHRLGDARFAEATREGTQTSWRQLITVTLA
ncbi:winged helix-turn-helix domain-containing protein [Amycolatopsis acidiphila]|uniref:AfsR/SARP family transcriptional regulator n=1 Tax=Amycolatopsis acidiphila TaxID=715473 RepID=A0A558AI05_9PSEU|nr:BTAD domain-containing putative transcriptional regulator [Amycolatopsis acidiphila]TVT23821.1 AfsR/SARP family transcriptional regulator [Amycolatopsis acidiphila]UIJ61202.1 winged helix-turn-helix domain-containing protein [Amycolatopsis acidiphila]GHG97873.1 SARP family transcriptional regulator [Amycolatopsis acidiphila]